MAPSLKREITVISGAALVVSNMIGTGIFTTTGFLAGDLGRPALVLGIWIVGAVVALAGCLSYAELGINLQRSGGEYAYVREAWGPTWGFVSGWVSFFAGFSAPIAAGSLALAFYVGKFVPALAGGTTPKLHGWLNLGAPQVLGIGVIAALAIVNIVGLGIAVKLQNFLTGAKLAVLGLFLVAAFAVGHGNWAHMGMATARTSPHGLGAQFAVSLIFVMFAYSGWNAANYVVEEMKTPETTLPVVLLFGTLLVTLLYFLLNVAYLFALPLENMKGVVPVGATAATALFGERAGDIFAGLFTVGLLSSISAMALVGPRVYYAMAQDACFPLSAARVHPRWRTPVNAILYQAAASAAMVLTGTFEKLVYYIGFTLILCAAMAVAGLLRLRHRPGWRTLKVVDLCYPAIPLAFLAASTWMLVWTFLFHRQESLLGLLTIACGALVYKWKGSRVVPSPESARAD